MFSLIIGSVLGLTQFRIKRLFAYSTISHVGFILLALSVNSSESIQSYIFYILQYSLSNLNAFIILVTIGYSFYLYTRNDNKQRSEDDKEIYIDRNNSPVQLINQIKGYFQVNPFISISLAITIFSFVGVPPILGFFAKQMVLSAALDNGFVFMTLIAILTSVIGAAYYLNLVKQMFFYNNNYKLNTLTNSTSIVGYVIPTPLLSKENKNINNNLISFRPENITVNSALSSTISVITLLLTLFIYMPEE
jgi:NADH-ubiquinone oxidoreductase chain 2